MKSNKKLSLFRRVNQCLGLLLLSFGLSHCGGGGGGGNSGGNGGGNGGTPPPPQNEPFIFYSQLDNTNGNSNVEPLSVDTDANGNSIVAGHFHGTVNFGGTSISSVDEDIFLVKIDKNGSHIWSKGFGGAQNQIARSVAFDSDGNIVLTGDFEGTLDFTNGTSPLQAAMLKDIFVAKLDSDGNYLWSQSFGGSLDDSRVSVVIDSTNNDIIAAGNFYNGTIKIGNTSLTSADKTDFFIAKLKSDGTVYSAKSFGAVGNQIVTSMTRDSSGHIIVAGIFEDSFSLDAVSLMTSTPSFDFFIAKFKSDGTIDWAKSFGDDQDQKYLFITASPDGTIVMTGDFVSELNFGNFTLTGQSGSRKIFMAKLDGTTGDHVWSQIFKRGLNTSDIASSSIVADSSNNIVLIGYVTGGTTPPSGSLDLGGGVFAQSQHGTVEDMYVVKFNQDGIHQWSKAFGDLEGGNNNRQFAYAVTVDPLDNVMVAGYFECSMDLSSKGLGVISDQQCGLSIGDMFLFRLVD